MMGLTCCVLDDTHRMRCFLTGRSENTALPNREEMFSLFKGGQEGQEKNEYMFIIYPNEQSSEGHSIPHHFISLYLMLMSKLSITVFAC